MLVVRFCEVAPSLGGCFVSAISGSPVFTFHIDARGDKNPQDAGNVIGAAIVDHMAKAGAARQRNARGAPAAATSRRPVEAATAWSSIKPYGTSETERGMRSNLLLSAPNWSRALLARPAFKLSGLIIPPLMLGIGIGIGAVGSASASTVTSAVFNAIKTAASVRCATTQTACLSVTNTVKNGVAILGASQNGLGIEGTSMSSVGVTGASQYSNGLNGKSVDGFGVHGVSTVSNGVVGTSNSGTGVGVVGSNMTPHSSDSAVGVLAQSVAGTALIASVLADAGGPFNFSPAVIVNAANTLGGAIDVESGNLQMREPSSAAAVATTDASGAVSTVLGGDAVGLVADNMIKANSGGFGPPGDGILGSSQYGNGIVGSTASGLVATAGVSDAPIPVAAISASAPNGADLYLGYGKGTFEVTNDGSVNASGTVTSGVTCAPTTCTDGTKLTTYAPHDASPTVEDFGRSQMVNGVAIVRFDPAFASTMNTGDYDVFITPEGENRGLYVARRTRLGFTVRESLGGHSTLGFSYRIVASPYASTAPRLPVIRTQRFAAAAFAQGQRTVKAMREKAAEMRSRINKLSVSKSLK